MLTSSWCTGSATTMKSVHAHFRCNHDCHPMQHTNPKWSKDVAPWKDTCRMISSRQFKSTNMIFSKHYPAFSLWLCCNFHGKDILVKNWVRQWRCKSHSKHQYHARHFFLNHPYLKAQQFLTLPLSIQNAKSLQDFKKAASEFCYQQSAAARHILIFTDNFSLLTQLFLFQPGFLLFLVCFP